MQIHNRLFTLLFLLIQTSCFVLVPFIKQDSQPQDRARLTRRNDFSACSIVRYTRTSRIQQELRNLEHHRDAVRSTAATELGFIGHGRPDVIKALKTATWKDPSKWVRRAAVKSLYKLQGKASIPTLKNALKDKDPWVVHSARNLIHKNK